MLRKEDVVAEEVQIVGTRDVAKIRSPLGVVGLSLITLGIYYLYWYFQVNNELSNLGESRGTEELGTAPTKSLLAMVPGFILIVPPFVSLFHTCQRINRGQHLTGEGVGLNPVLGFVLSVLLGPVGMFLMQGSLNHIWDNQRQR
jgi:hypothetical protein